MEPRHIISAAIAASVIGHAALAVGVFFADARPFDPSATRDIAVDIVTPQQVAEAARQEPPAPDKQPDPFRLPELTDKPQPENAASAAAAKPAASPAAPQRAAAEQPPPSAAEAPAQQPPATGAASSAAPAGPPPQQQAALQTPPASAAPQAEPDVTVKYGVMLGLPDGNGGSEAMSKADIAPLDIEAFRRHLKNCSILPAGVSRGDKVRVVLRAFLAPNGRLTTEPMLIEAPASSKGPLLMQAAMKALQVCQPYAMLPADKYSEWKVLDLAFTPQDFSG